MTAVGLDVGGTWLKLVVLDGDRVVHSERRRLPETGLLDFVADTARIGLRDHSARSLGVGLAGLVRHPEGELVWGPHLEGQSVPYRRTLEERLGVSVAVDNDANFAALAEVRMGAGEGHDPVLLVALGTGIGVGVVVGGRVFRGGSFAGESGHMTVQDDGCLCACGRRGCWETVVSGSELDRTARRLDPRGVATAADLVAWAEEGNDDARKALAQAGDWLGTGLVTLTLAFDPELVVVGGAVAAAGDLLLVSARERLASDLPGARYRPQVPVVAARLGGFAGAVGAALAGGVVHNGDNDW